MSSFMILKDMVLSNNNDIETIAIFEGEEAKAFIEYAHSESTPQEKKELQKALEFYKQHCPKVIEKE